MRAVVGAARAEERPRLSRILTDHLGAQAGGYDVVEGTWAGYDHVNVQAGLDAWLTDEGCAFELVGVAGFQHTAFGLGDLVSSGRHEQMHGPSPGNPSSVNLACGPDGEVRPCIRCAIYLVIDGQGEDRSVRTAILLQFHRRPPMGADQLVLSPETLAEVHRQVVEVARHKNRLLEAGQHLTRGLLLYGPPGTGKTHTVRYLTSSLVGTTVVQLTGNALHLIAQACSVARTLQPAMLVSRTST
jgi:hypothetical protein